LILHSRYYSAAPLSIAGPGAGIDLTATAVFADVLAAAQRHIARGVGVVTTDAAIAA